MVKVRPCWLRAYALNLDVFKIGCLSGCSGILASLLKIEVFKQFFFDADGGDRCPWAHARPVGVYPGQADAKWTASGMCRKNSSTDSGI